jgi:serine protease
LPSPRSPPRCSACPPPRRPAPTRGPARSSSPTGRRTADVRYAVPNVVAHAAEAFVPNDPGRTTTPGGWQETQWNFAGPASVNAPDAWGNLIAAGHPGGKGVVVAVLDTGVA